MLSIVCFFAAAAGALLLLLAGKLAKGRKRTATAFRFTGVLLILLGAGVFCLIVSGLLSPPLFRS